jgi:hypothetical protein
VVCFVQSVVIHRHDIHVNYDLCSAQVQLWIASTVRNMEQREQVLNACNIFFAANGRVRSITASLRPVRSDFTEWELFIHGTIYERHIVN